MKLFNSRNEMIKELVATNGTYAEIGVFEGVFSKYILEVLQPTNLYMIDLFKGMCDSGNEDGNNVISRNMDDMYIKLLREMNTEPSVHILKGNSIDILATFPDNTLDMIYIDGDHSYNGCKHDLSLAYEKVKNGGWIMGHDYEMNMVKARTYYNFGVKQAVDEFCSTRNQEIYAKALDGCVSFAIQLHK